MRAALEETVARGTPRAASVAFLLRRTARPRPQPVAVTSRPDLADLAVTPASPAIYDELTRTEDEDE